jgi:CheY-like chemotaxis protein
MAETILLVENEFALRELMRRFLEGSGYSILGARDGDEALAVADRPLAH